MAKRTTAEDRIQSRLSNERTDELLAIATEVFLEKGFDGASVGEMATRAKSSKATYYNRYPTKQLLFAAIIRRGTDRVEAGFTSIVRNDESVESVLQGIGERVLALVLLPESIKIDRVISMEAQRFPELGKLFYESGPGRVAEFLASYLKQKTTQGELSVPHPRLAAEQFIDMVSGFLLRRAVLGLEEHPTTRERNQRINAAIDVFLKAYKLQKK